MKINGIQVEMPKLELDKPKTMTEDKGFGQMIVDGINDVNTLQVEGDQAIENLLTGKSRNMHETMVALEKAEISLKLMSGIRRQALDAYNSVLKMQ